MSINELVIQSLKKLKLPISVSENPSNDENGRKKLPESFLVIIPIFDGLDGYADNQPTEQSEEIELALYTKGNYLQLRDAITKLLLGADITITGRRYIEYEGDTGYHHYIFELVKAQEFEMEEK